jgi:hypothetical protein
MKVTHPFTWLSAQRQRWALLVFLVLALLAMAALRVFDAPLKTEASPSGIVSFELAGTTAAAESILVAWDAQASIYAGLSLGLDYVFLLTYGAGISLACAMVVGGLQARRRTAARIGLALSWLVLVAALLDAVENLALIRILIGRGGNPWPSVARWCAIPKFGIVFAGLLYIIMGGISLLVIRLARSVKA